MTSVMEKLKNDKMAFSEILAGIVLLIISIPVFLDYNMFGVINAQIGPHQIASWLALTFTFIGFILIVMGMGKIDE